MLVIETGADIDPCIRHSWGPSSVSGGDTASSRLMVKKGKLILTPPSGHSSNNTE
jgi:hypothetical protein